MKRGFTLVELLGVIIILSLIFAIIAPNVLNLTNSSKKSTDLASAESYLKVVEQTILNKNLESSEEFTPNECIIQSNGNLTCDGILLEVVATGIKPTGGTITFITGKPTEVYLIYSDVSITLNNKGELVHIPEAKSFAEDSWDTIVANVRAGNLSKYKVGDTKEIALTGFTNGEEGSNGLYTVRIANTTNTGDVCTKEYLEREDGTKEKYSKTACGFVIEFEDIISEHVMNSTGTNAGGWEASEMRDYVNETIYNALPEDLKKVIIETTVVSGYRLGDSTNKETTDKLYLLSTAEIWEQGTSDRIDSDTERDVTRQLDYYKNYENEDGSIGVTTDNHSGAIKKCNGSASRWWLRSAYSIYSTSFYHVYSTGNWSRYTADGTHGVAVAFRIG